MTAAPEGDVGTTGPASAPESDLFAVGTRVEVRNAFDGSWSRGFTIVDSADGNYRIKRRSDDTVLPGTFAPGDVRRERKRSTWWV